MKHFPVDYDNEQHLYSYNGKRYISATQLLDKFKHGFDVEERSVYMADRYGNTPQYWKDKWRDINGESLKRGNDIHNREEKELYQKKFIDHNPYPLPVLQCSDGVPYSKLPDGVYPEMKMWRHDHGIAGRSDKVILRSLPVLSGKSTVHRYADIEDYKTNKRIRLYSFQYPDGTYQMMKEPLSHLMDCEMNHITLQLSLYQYMMEYFGFLPGRRRIIHFPHQIEGLGIPKPVSYTLSYMRNEVLGMLKHISVLKTMPV